MAFTDLFIRRPILSIVLSLFILLVGASALFLLPVRQYPFMQSATIVIDVNYPGATEAVMQGFVTTPISQAACTSGCSTRVRSAPGHAPTARASTGPRRSP